MIIDLLLENFKCFGDSEVVRFAPITLIYGENSAGKSSILQALYVLKQTVELARPSTPLLLHDSRGYAQLGSFREVVHNGRKDAPMRIGVLTGIEGNSSGEEPDVDWFEKTISTFACAHHDEVQLISLEQGCAYGGFEHTASGLRLFKQACNPSPRVNLTRNGNFLAMCPLLEDYRQAYELHSRNRGIMQKGIRLLKAVHALNVVRETPEGTLLANNMWYHDQPLAIRDFDASLFDIPDSGVGTPRSSKGQPAWLQTAIDDGWVCGHWARSSPVLVRTIGLVDGDEHETARPADCHDVEELTELLAKVIHSHAYSSAISSSPPELILAEDFYNSEFTYADYVKRQQTNPPSLRWLPEHFYVSGQPEFRMAQDDLIYNAGRGFIEYRPSSNVFSSEGKWQVALPKTRNVVLIDNELLNVSMRKWCTVDSLRGLRPIAPLRAAPRRLYQLTGQEDDSIGFAGENLIGKLIRSPELVQEVEEWANRVGIDYDFSVRNFDEVVANVAVLAVRDRRNTDAPWMTLADVGAGVAQILPILFNGLAVTNSTITIEQPELHIHPRCQAEIGSFLAHSAKQNDNQFIVETHSEHLMLRIQKLIRNGDLCPDDVSVLYVSRGDDGSTVQKLRLDEDGEFLDPWPDGFFPERMKEIFGQ